MVNLIDNFIGSIVKGFFWIFALIFIVFVGLCIVGAIQMDYNRPKNIAVENGFEIHYSKHSHLGYVSSYTLDNYTANMKITLPDSYDGAIINEIGGAQEYGNTKYLDIFIFKMSKLVGKNIIESNVSSEYDDKAKNIVYDINYYDLNLCVGKNIEKINSSFTLNQTYKIFDEETSTLTIHVYQPRVYVDVSSDNKYFYSKDGKVYRKRDNSLITKFFYYDSTYEKEKIGVKQKLD